MNVLRRFLPLRMTAAASAPASSACSSSGWWGWTWRRAALTAGGCAAGVALGAGLTAAAVLCRPLDTPSYLIPYYLRDVGSRFQHYASVRKRRGGPKYMTADDFVRALLGTPDDAPATVAAAEELRELFVAMDSNGDGFLSFPEFRLLMALLTAAAEDVELLFRVVDEGHKGRIGIEQFGEVLRGLTGEEAVVRSFLKPSRRRGATQLLFGTAEEPRECTCAELLTFVSGIRRAVWAAEFRQHDPQRTGAISAEDFSQLLSSHVLGTHLPFYLVQNIRRLRGGDARITVDMWIAFNELMQGAEQLRTALEIYCASGRPVTRPVLLRALKVAGMQPPPPETLDVLFAVFDRNDDGSIEIDEFLSIVQQKMSFHYKAPPRTRKPLPTRLYECSLEAAQNLYA